jgi:hypothetical protein
MPKILQLALAAFLALSLSVLALGQSQATTGQIVGQVTDPNGQAVPNATVTITNAARGFKQTLTTNNEGSFRAGLLPPGNYDVEVKGQGFGANKQTGYVVEVGSTIDANIVLQVQDVTAEVTVTAAAVETTVSQTTTNINSTSISQLPINGRRFQDFVLLTPSADTDPVRNQISLAGQRGINAQIQIDGADYTNPFFGGIRGGERSNQAFTFPQSAIREFQVVTTGYNAEFGRSTGGIVNAVTKSGTNDVNGEAFYAVRPARFAHRNAFGQVAAPTQHQVGGGVGGPIVANKAFFFGSIEYQKLNQQRAVLFDLLQNFNTTTNLGTADAFNFYKGLEGPYTQTNDAIAFIGRFDYNINSSNQFNVRFNYSKNTADNAVTAGASLQPTTNSATSNNGTEGNDQKTLVGQLTTTFNPNLLNEFRAQYSRENRPRTPNEISPLVSNAVGSFGTVSFLPTTQYDYRVQFANATTLNKGRHSLKFGVESNYTFADQLFAFRQTGNFDFGGVGSNVASILQILTVGNAGGASDPANRFDNTNITYRRNIGNGLAQLDSSELAAFFQDSWRATPRLTINYGLRWESQLMPDPNTSQTSLTEAVRNAPLPLYGGRMIDPTDIPNQVKQFAPRLGLAWSPFADGRGVFRAYTGVFFARTPLLTLAGPINNFRSPPGDVTLQLSGFTAACAGGIANTDPRCPSTIYKQFLTIGINLNTFALNQLPILTPDQVRQIRDNVAAARGLAVNPFDGLQLVTIGGDQFRNPRSFQFGGAFEREIRNGITLGVTYDQVNTIHLNRNRDVDVPVPVVRANDMSRRPIFGIAGNTALGVNQNRPIAALGNFGFVQIREASGRSLYQAVTFRAVKRSRKGQFDVFYTLSRSLDDDSTERNATFSEYDNSFDLRPEYNYSRNDRRHQFVANVVYDVPFGFQVSATTRMRSGLPFDQTVSGIVAPVGSGLSNAQYAAQVTLSGSTSGDLNLDRGNFSDRPYIAPGVPFKRNAGRNRSVYNVDFRLQRDIKFGERFRLSPTFEVFNLFKFKNIEYAGTTAFNWGNPGVNERTGEVLQPTNPNYLRLRATNGSYLLNNRPGNPLQMQFSIRAFF